MTSNNKTNRTVEKNMDRIMELLSKLRFYGMLETYRNDCRTTSSDGMTNDEFLDFIKDGQNVFITGSSGTGKSYIASAIGYEACKNGIKTLYSNASKLMGSLKLPKIRAL